MASLNGLFSTSVSPFTIAILSIISFICSIDASVPIEGRFSFSLTTFSNTGILPQLQNALKASALGPAVVAVSLKNGKGIFIASIQSLPSSLYHDDGTSRFMQINDSIVVAHTGINADGRVLVAAAQRLAVEHAYTFKDEIPIGMFLEEMSLLFQEYTMKPGSRPFGCSLIVVHLGRDQEELGYLYRIDPSGSITILKNIAHIGRGDTSEICKQIEESKCVDASSIEEVEDTIVQLFKDEIEQKLMVGEDQMIDSPQVVISTIFTKETVVFKRY